MSPFISRDVFLTESPSASYHLQKRKPQPALILQATNRQAEAVQHIDTQGHIGGQPASCFFCFSQKRASHTCLLISKTFDFFSRESFKHALLHLLSTGPATADTPIRFSCLEAADRKCRRHRLLLQPRLLLRAIEVRQRRVIIVRGRYTMATFSQVSFISRIYLIA